MKECEKCGVWIVPVVETYGESIITSCPYCYNFNHESCKHEKSSMIKYLLNGNYRVQEMCSSCYRLHGHYLKQTNLNLNNIKEIDKKKYDDYQEKLSKEHRERWMELTKLHTEWNKTAWFDEHNEYLKSTEWKEKRDEVLKRDNYLCQACLKARATQVHHLNYNHWRHEPFFELVSICKECHEIITKIDQSKK